MSNTGTKCSLSTMKSSLLVLLLASACHAVITDFWDTFVNQKLERQGIFVNFPILPRPITRDLTSFCNIVTLIDNALYTRDIIGQITASLTVQQCIAACVQHPDCISINYLPQFSRCYLSGSGESLNDVMKEEFPNLVHPTELNFQHMLLHVCFDKDDKRIRKHDFTSKPITTSRPNVPITSSPKPTPTFPPTSPPPPVVSDGCGKQSIQPLVSEPGRNRITNGNEAVPNSWPWIVSLQYFGQHFCGGTLLQTSTTQKMSDIVLTASHCVIQEDGPLPTLGFKVVLGDHSLATLNAGQKSVQVAKFINNPEYGKGDDSLLGDVAIVKLSTPVEFTKTIQPICISAAGEKPDKTSVCVAAGWGNTNEINNENYPDKLQQLKVPVLDDTVCTRDDIWTSDLNVTARMCAGYLQGKYNVCSGDSGGPLMCSKNGQWTQFGVASFVSKDGCQKENKPGVFARISTYNNWIMQTARSLTTVK